MTLSHAYGINASGCFAHLFVVCGLTVQTCKFNYGEKLDSLHLVPINGSKCRDAGGTITLDAVGENNKCAMTCQTGYYHDDDGESYDLDCDPGNTKTKLKGILGHPITCQSMSVLSWHSFVTCQHLCGQGGKQPHEYD